jgi:hypothetical protein
MVTDMIEITALAVFAVAIYAAGWAMLIGSMLPSEGVNDEGRLPAFILGAVIAFFPLGWVVSWLLGWADGLAPALYAVMQNAQ